ncbi:zinc finger protein-like 1 homolog [Eurytemora carolleeae]|uniref:zinc finger protein-like 1 homolog n=1 Tax=Eurytemora carolleeae TaxID=1294199 RepID=UPI000C77D977|nr:zinc finger protein-like 1 homolog [Eurytemora carolleeae]|eukprot:XP_023330295.1 zinc finger protein-like 1 homolog [Eurytemora affinis]
MGLCKCPKRKVTNQFCFEHRVNVCEHCMVNSHKKCVVQSYLAWLQDSDFSPDCGFCRSNLAEEECVRLTCYCLYHWSCLDNHCRNLPANTAPAGYICTQCDASIFPPDNLVSPVADQLRKLLQDVNWARAGLGLPLLADNVERKPGSAPVGPRPTPEGEDKSGDTAHLAHELASGKKGGRNTSGGWKNDTVVNFEASTSRRLNSDASLSSPLLGGGDPDSDSNKYKRRSPTELLFRWLKSLTKPAAQRRRGPAGYCMLILTLIIVIASLAAIFSWVGRDGYEDPMLDPLNNPNIRVGDI